MAAAAATEIAFLFMFLLPPSVKRFRCRSAPSVCRSRTAVSLRLTYCALYHPGHGRATLKKSHSLSDRTCQSRNPAREIIDSLRSRQYPGKRIQCKRCRRNTPASPLMYKLNYTLNSCNCPEKFVHCLRHICPDTFPADRRFRHPKSRFSLPGVPDSSVACRKRHPKSHFSLPEVPGLE